MQWWRFKHQACFEAFGAGKNHWRPFLLIQPPNSKHHKRCHPHNSRDVKSSWCLQTICLQSLTIKKWKKCVQNCVQNSWRPLSSHTSPRQDPLVCRCHNGGCVSQNGGWRKASLCSIWKKHFCSGLEEPPGICRYPKTVPCCHLDWARWSLCNLVICHSRYIHSAWKDISLHQKQAPQWIWYWFCQYVLASLEDRFGTYPQFMLMKPHCMATITDPSFS